MGLCVKGKDVTTCWVLWLSGRARDSEGWQVWRGGVSRCLKCSGVACILAKLGQTPPSESRGHLEMRGCKSQSENQGLCKGNPQNGTQRIPMINPAIRSGRNRGILAGWIRICGKEVEKGFVILV